MKAISTCIFFSWLLWLPVAAQVYQPLPDQSEPGLVSIGLRSGVGLSTLVGEHVNDSLSVGGTPGYKVGVTLGLVVTSQLRPTFWLTHELWFQPQGAMVYLHDEAGQSYASQLKIQYLNVYPANVTFVGKNLRLYSGPYIGMALSASIQRKDPSGHLQTDPTIYGTAQTMSGDIAKIDAGLCAGIDYRFTDRWTIGLRLQHGVIPIWNENTLSQNGQAKVYTQNGLLSLGYQLSR